jgi:hypothetical protein
VDRDVATAERRAAEIVREAEEEAFLILEQAATVAFKGRRQRASRMSTKLLALGSFGLAVAAVVEISMGRI